MFPPSIRDVLLLLKSCSIGMFGIVLPCPNPNPTILMTIDGRSLSGLKPQYAFLKIVSI